MSDWDKIRKYVEDKVTDPIGDTYRANVPGRINPPKTIGTVTYPKWKSPDPWFEDNQVKDFAVSAGLSFAKMQMGMTKFGMDSLNEAFNPFKKMEYARQLEDDWNDGYYIRSALGVASLVAVGSATVPLTIYDSYFSYQNPTRDRRKPNFRSYGDWYGPHQGEAMAGFLGFRDHYQEIYSGMKTAYNWAEWNVWGRYHKKPKGGKDDRYERVRKFRERNPWNP